MCNKTDCDNKANCQDKKLCHTCKVYLGFDKFKKKRDDTYLVCCIECNLKNIIWQNKNKCEHGRKKSECKDCGGASICEHDRTRIKCKDCGGSQICKHKKERTKCKICGGGSICEHKKIRSKCKDCKGGSICEHGIHKINCKECDFGGYLRQIVSVRCRNALKANKSESTIEYLGCNITIFKKHIESQFHPEMSWDNYGEWEIDHIVPIKYNKPTLDQQIARLHYTNTQPLWKDDNLSKGNKTIYGVLYNHDFHQEFKDCKN